MSTTDEEIDAMFRKDRKAALRDAAAYRALRPEVRAFAQAIEDALRSNDAKGGWDNCSEEYLVTKLAEEVGEVAALVVRGTGGPSDHIRRECADVAAMALMLWDNARAR